MADKKTKIPGPDHPISIDANPSRAVGSRIIWISPPMFQKRAGQ